MTKALSFTGHRPKNLVSVDMDWVESRLENAIERAIKNGFTRFISGAALGIDQLAADIVVSLKNQYSGISLCLAIPYESQADYWSKTDREHYNWLKTVADEVLILFPNPKDFNQAKQYLHARNRWMVENSSALVAVWDGRPSGGTSACTYYARSVGRPVLYINPVSQVEEWIK